MPRLTNLTVCELCQEAINQEFTEAEGGNDEQLSQRRLISLAVSFGAEIPDHNCQAVENANLKCDCGCRRH